MATTGSGLVTARTICTLSVVQRAGAVPEDKQAPFNISCQDGKKVAALHFVSVATAFTITHRITYSESPCLHLIQFPDQHGMKNNAGF